MVKVQLFNYLSTARVWRRSGLLHNILLSKSLDWQQVICEKNLSEIDLENVEANGEIGKIKAGKLKIMENGDILQFSQKPVLIQFCICYYTHICWVRVKFWTDTQTI